MGRLLRLLAALRGWHARLAPSLEIPRDRIPLWLFSTLTLLIVILGAVLRAHLLFEPLTPSQLWNGQPLLTSMDGYYFAAGVAQSLGGALGPDAYVAYGDQHALVALGSTLVRLLGVEREVIFTWLPILLGPLVAIPLALIGRAIERSIVGLVAALGAVIAPAYLVRSSAGYFDTDLFAVTVPLVAALYVVRLLRPRPLPPAPEALTAARRDGFLAALWLSLYPWTYDQGTPLAFAIAACALLSLLYAALAVSRAPTPDDDAQPVGGHQASRHALLIALAILPLAWPLRTGAIVLVHLALTGVFPRARWLALAATAAAVFALFASPAVHEALSKVDAYANRDTPPIAAPGDSPPAPPPSESAAWKRQDTTATVGEVQVTGFVPMGSQLAGHSLLALFGALGFLLLVAWWPGLWVLLPMAAIGAFAFAGGQRFLIYASPIAFLGLAYLAAAATRPLRHSWRAAATGVLGIALALPAYDRLAPRAAAIVLASDDAAALSELATRAGPDDLTISWWDFGYPITYFAHTHALCNGSRRGDDASFAAEILLTRSPALAARLARLSAAALTAHPVRGAADPLIADATRQGLGPAAFLAAVESGRYAPALTSAGAATATDVYLYLPWRLVPILPLLEATRPTPAGAARDALSLSLHPGVKSDKGMLYLEDGLAVDADAVRMVRTTPDGTVLERALREVQVIAGSGPTHTVKRRRGDPSAATVGILLRDLRLFMEIDAVALDSQWARLFLYEDADPRYYEPVLLTPGNKIYRFK